MNDRNSSGFTLVELLVVVAVIGVLTAGMIALINPEHFFQQARNAQRKKDLRIFANALEAYAAIYGSYPSTAGQWCTTSYSDPNVTSFKLCSGNPSFSLIPLEFKNLPVDPKSGIGNNMSGIGSASCANAGYPSYLYRSDGVNYKVLAHCTPEGSTAAQTFSASDPFYDPIRPNHAWQISTPAVRSTW